MTKFDVIIIGGGPAGISAAIWCADQRLNALLLDRADDLGGQLKAIYGPITNYPGLDLANGEDLRGRMIAQIKRTEVGPRTAADVSHVELGSGLIKLADGQELSARSFVIATGVRRRVLNVPGEKEFGHGGVLLSGIRDQKKVVGRKVVIVGGGDAALENALILSKAALQVTLIHRRGNFSAREEFISAVEQHGNIDILLDTKLSRITGDDQLRAVEIESGGEKRTLECDNLLIRIGVVPNTELFREQVAVDGSGYIVVDHQCRTSLASVFAIGDVANPTSPTISTAIGMASTAVKTIWGNLHTPEQ